MRIMLRRINAFWSDNQVEVLYLHHGSKKNTISDGSLIINLNDVVELGNE